MSDTDDPPVRLETSSSWTDFYYDIIEAYFWRPQVIGRASNPKQASMPWRHWEGKLRSQEEPLNHLLDLLLHLCPRELLDGVAQELLGREINGLELVRADGLSANIVQPDIILRNDAELVFVEMKVDSRSSIDQVGKYGVAALEITAGAPEIQTVELVVLARHAEHQRVWKSAKRLGLTSESAVRDAVLRAVRGQDTLWKEKGVPRYLSRHPDRVDALAESVAQMTIVLSDYRAVQRALEAYRERTPVVRRLVDGFLRELKGRALID